MSVSGEYNLEELDLSKLPARFMALADEYDPHRFWAGLIVTLICFYLLLRLLRLMPKAWGWTKIRYNIWKEDREMRRERTLLQQRAFADAIEDTMSKLLDEGDMDPKTASEYRHFFAQKIPELKPKKDTKLGIASRILSGIYDRPAPLPDRTQEADAKAPVIAARSTTKFGQ